MWGKGEVKRLEFGLDLLLLKSLIKQYLYKNSSKCDQDKINQKKFHILLK